LLGNMNLFVIYHHRLYTFGHFVKIGFPHDDKWEKRYSNYVVGQHKGFTHNNSYKSHCLKGLQLLIYKTNYFASIKEANSNFSILIIYIFTYINKNQVFHVSF